jgi:hypothetical protein
MAGKVLYLALEDSPRRLQRRLRQQNVPADAPITFVTDWPLLGEGGLEKLEEELRDDSLALVIIDTLSRWLGRADQNDLAEMTAQLGQMQRMAQDKGVTILFVDHHRKNGNAPDDPIDDILGSTGKAAVVDAAMGLYRERGKHEFTLRVTGRDLEEKELALIWDGQLCCWQSLGDAGGVRPDTLKGGIVETIDQLEELGQMATVTRIAQYLGKDTGNISRALNDLIAAGKIAKGEKQGREQPYEVVEEV